MSVKQMFRWGGALLLTAGLVGAGMSSRSPLAGLISADGPAPGQSVGPHSPVPSSASSPRASVKADGFLFPEEDSRLAEQIETVRLGLEAGASGRTFKMAPPAATAYGTGLGLLAAGAGLIGCGLGFAGAVTWTRRRSNGRKAHPKTPRARVEPVLEEPAEPAPAAAPSPSPATSPAPAAAPMPPASPAPEPAPAHAAHSAPPSETGTAPGTLPINAPLTRAVEDRLQLLEDSLLQILQTVEGMAAQGLATPAEHKQAAAPQVFGPPPAATPRGLSRATKALLESSVRLEPAARPDSPLRQERPTPPEAPTRTLSVEPSPASTVDGRSLGRVRQAVLRLAEAGWDSERIARRLRLGSGDVTLILKSAASPRPTGRALDFPAHVSRTAVRKFGPDDDKERGGNDASLKPAKQVSRME